MSPSQATRMQRSSSVSSQPQQQPVPVQWDQIREPGAYIDAQTGVLYRITQESLSTGALAIGRESQSELVRISHDPFVTNTQARFTAAKNEHRTQPCLIDFLVLSWRF